MDINEIKEKENGSADINMELTNEENDILVEYAVNDILEKYISDLHDYYKVMDLGNGMYRLACDCIDQDHDITFDFDYDREYNIVELDFYMNFDYSTNHYYNNSSLLGKFFKSFWFRIKHSFILLTRGYIKVHSGVTITHPEHINSFIRALHKSKEWMEAHQKNMKTKE